MDKTKEEQVKIIRRVLIEDRLDTCGGCGLTVLSWYTKGGHPLCPDCDSQTIEDYQSR